MSGRKSVKSAVRVFEVLEYFVRAREPARLRDIVQALGHPTSSVDVLLKTMVAKGYLQFDPLTHCYFPTHRVAQLGTWIPAGGFEHSVVLEYMYALRDGLRAPVVLATPNGIHLEYVQSLPGFDGMNTFIAPGTRRVLVQTGTGWLFLNQVPVEEALAVYRRTIRSKELSAAQFCETDFLDRISDHRKLEVSFVKARDLVRPTAHWDAAMLSLLIPTPDGHRPLALGVHGPCRRIEERRAEIEHKLVRARDEIDQHVKLATPTAAQTLG